MIFLLFYASVAYPVIFFLRVIKKKIIYETKLKKLVISYSTGQNGHILLIFIICVTCYLLGIIKLHSFFKLFMYFFFNFWGNYNHLPPSEYDTATNVDMQSMYINVSIYLGFIFIYQCNTVMFIGFVNALCKSSILLFLFF